MSKRIAIFGGSFDPPHAGHGAAVDALAKMEFLDEVWVVPSEDCDYKDLTSIKDRLEMLELWISEATTSDKVRVMFWEHPIPHHFSKIINLINFLEERYPHRFYFCVGSDQAKNIPSWYKAKELFKRENLFIVLSRPGHEEDNIEFNHLSLRIENGLELSSTYVREKIDQGETLIEGLTPKVLNSILTNGIY